MNPYGLLASGAHLTGGSRLPDAIHRDDAPARAAGALDDMLARSALGSVNAFERLARRVLGRA